MMNRPGQRNSMSAGTFRMAVKSTDTENWKESKFRRLVKF